jgi:polysaccharide pyruvyl transferase WcaK-like protein
LKLLVDHGAYNNLGDIAQIEGAVSKLGSVLQGADIFVVDRPSIRTEIWNLPRVHRQNEYRVNPPLADLFARAPFVWRYADRWRRLTEQLALIWLERLGAPSTIRLRGGDAGNGQRASLGDFCAPFDALLVSGGGNLTDTFHGQLFHKCCLILAFTASGKPVVLTGQQLGPFRSPLFRRLLGNALRRARFVGLREPGDSLALCREAGVEPRRAEVMGDDSFGLRPVADTLVVSYLSERGLQPDRFLALNVRISSYAPELARRLDRIAALVDRLARELAMPVLIVPILVGSPTGDIASGMKVAALTRSARVVSMDDEVATPALVKGIVGRAFGAVGTAYHFCTFALSQGVPAVCVYDGPYYAQRARGLAEFWGDARLDLSLGGAEPEAAATWIARVLQDRPWRAALARRAAQSVARWHEVFESRVAPSISGRG